MHRVYPGQAPRQLHIEIRTKKFFKRSKVRTSVVEAAEGSGAARGAAGASGVGSKRPCRRAARSPRGYGPVVSLVRFHTGISSYCFVSL